MKHYGFFLISIWQKNKPSYLHINPSVRVLPTLCNVLTLITTNIKTHPDEWTTQEHCVNSAFNVKQSVFFTYLNLILKSDGLCFGIKSPCQHLNWLSNRADAAFSSTNFCTVKAQLFIQWIFSINTGNRMLHVC